MNQRAALRETVALAERLGMPEMDASSTGLAHLRSMAAAVDAAEFPADKLGRWLGWAQCALVVADVGATLDDMRELNLRYQGPA